MTYRMEQPSRGTTRRAASFAALVLLALCLPGTASAQWATNGNDISNTNTGNVGVGTSTPAQIFHVHGIGTWAGTRVTTAATGSTVNDGVNFGYDDAYGAYIWNREATPIVFAAGNAEKMRLDASGNLGVGTSPVYARLHLYSPGHSWLRIGAPIAYQSGVLFNDDTNGFDVGLYRPEGTRDFAIWMQTAGGNVLRMTQAGNVGIGTNTPAAKLDVAGDVKVSGNLNAKYQDVAEWVPSTQKLSVGMVVVLDPERRNHVIASTTSYDTAVAGVISEKPGLTLGEAGEGKALVATTGRVKVRVDAARAPIRAGDLLVTSDVPGVAMKSEPVSLGGVSIHRPGTIIGKALEPLAGGTGEILVLLSLQ